MADISSYTSAILSAIYGRDVRQSLVDALNKVNDDNNSYAQIKSDILKAQTEINTSVSAWRTAVSNAATAKTELQSATSSANTAKSNLNTAITNAGTSKSQLETAISNASTSKTNLEAAISSANTAKTNAETAKKNLDASVSTANTLKTNLDNSISSANTAKSNLDSSTKTANTAKSNIDLAITNAGTSKSELEAVITNAGTSKSQLSTIITNAEKVKGELATVIGTGNTLLANLKAENASAKSNIAELRSENFNSKEILTGVTDLRAYLGLENSEVVGVQVDLANKTFRRLAGAEGLSGGADFDKFKMFGGRKRCNVNDAGVITAFRGDAGYTEDGSNGQVMVYQPKFYYMMYPLVVEKNTVGIGYHLRKANYYVSDYPLSGFKLHPAFYDANGNELDYIFLSAYEGSLYDMSASAFILDDAQVMDNTVDKFCSIANAKPASGKTQDLTRVKIEQMAQNRGSGWHGDYIKPCAANQMLMIIEMGMMNLQTAIGQGVVSISDTPNTDNNSIITGGTASLGDSTGQATGTSGKVSITYRGMENPWGNIWKFVYGINIWGNGSLGGGVPYYANDLNFAENKNTDNYVSAGFSVTNANGYISAFGYAPECDWLFIASECLGNSSLPVGDYTYITANLNGYRIALLGGRWNGGGIAGGFCWALSDGVGSRSRIVGGRLVYVPDTTSDAYTQSQELWASKMAA